MTTQFPGYTQAVEADERQRSSGRPPWAQEQYNIEKGHGKVAKVEEAQRATSNGKSITFYKVILANPVIESAATPVTGEAYLCIDAPNPGGKLGVRQPYFWTMEKLHEADPAANDIGYLTGKDIAFVLKARKPFEETEKSGKVYDSYYYEITLGAGTSSNGHTAPTAERLDEAALIVVGLTHAQALEVLEDEGPQIMANLIRTKKVKQVEGVYQAV